MATPINSTKAAALIVSETGRRCSRQNLEDISRNGALRDSPAILQLKPFRFDAETVVQEYLRRVDARQTAHHPPKPKPIPVSPSDPPTTPDYAESRALREHQLALMAQMDRRKREGELLERAEVERAWAQSVTIAKTALLGVPSRAKERIPHLTLDEIGTITELIRSALEEVANAAAE